MVKRASESSPAPQEMETPAIKREPSEESTSKTAEKPSTSKTTAKRRPKRKSRPRRSAAGGPSAGDSDTEQLKNRLLKRQEKDDQSKNSRSAKMEAERGPIIRRRPQKGTSDDQNDATCFHEVVNPSGYDKLFTRLEESHFNKAVKPDGECLDNSPWVCCFCLKKPCVDDLGDLFGPYYVKLSPPTFWPPFLDRDDKSMKKTASDSGVNTDLWFHGDCVYWAPGVLLRGWGMTDLEEHLPKYWNQKCVRCQELGASITCAAKGCGQSFHFPCAVSAGAVFKEATHAMYCETHKKLAEKRK